jgi:predicted peptidase
VSTDSLNAAILSICATIFSSAAIAAETTDVSPLAESMFIAKSHTASNGDVLLYRFLEPEQLADNQNYPLVIFLHGAGERGDDNLAQLKHGLSELCTAERRKQFPCFVIAPQCPPGQRWADIDWTKPEVQAPSKISRSLELTFEVVDRLISELPIDPTRIYITGLSMGGYGSWDALSRRPGFFAAAMPICGGGDPATADAIRHIPIACFHGELDKAVSPDKSRKMIEALRKSGATPIYVEYPGVGHDSWTQTYAEDKNWSWLFNQRLTK